MCKAIEVFKTNVKSQRIAKSIVKQLITIQPAGRFTFDLEDCDRILRAEFPKDGLNSQEICLALRTHGFFCEILDDEENFIH